MTNGESPEEIILRLLQQAMNINPELRKKVQDMVGKSNRAQTNSRPDNRKRRTNGRGRGRNSNRKPRGNFRANPNTGGSQRRRGNGRNGRGNKRQRQRDRGNSAN